MRVLSSKNKNSKTKKSAPKLAINPIQLGVFAAALAINAAIIFWSYKNFVTDPQQEKLEQVSLAHAKDSANRIKFRIDKLQQLLDQFGQRQALIDAIGNSTNETSAWVNSLIQALPDDSAVALIDNSRPTEDQNPGITFRFAELDLINRAKKGEQPPPEVGGKGPDRALTLVSSVGLSEQSKKAKGTLVAQVPMAFLNKAITPAEEKGGYRLVQTFTNRAETIARYGSGYGPKISAPLNNIWSVEFQANLATIDLTKSSPLALYAAWLLMLAASFYGAWWLSNKLVAAEKLRQAKLRTPDAALSGAGKGSHSKESAASVMGVEVAEDDQRLLSGDGTSRTGKSSNNSAEELQFPAHVFRAYDIRGLAGKEINRDFAAQLGRAIGTRVLADGNDSLFVGRDGRTSSPELYHALIDGILSTGANTRELGLIPTPLLHYAIAVNEDCKSGVIVTASHNGAAYNGFKVCLNEQTLADDDIQELRQAMTSGNFQSGHGNTSQSDITEAYIDEILADVALMGDVRIVIDAANGATSAIAPLLFTDMGCDVVPLYCEADGNFPNHDPDPSNPINLQDLIAKVKTEEADLGVAFDGDGDRIFVVTASGAIITPDRLLMLFAKDIVSRNPGTDVIYDVKCTRQLGSLISSYGGRPIMWKTGHAHMKRKMQDSGALLGGEFSGHIFIKDRWYGFDDGMLVAARLLEIMSLREQSLDEIFEAFPVLPATPEIRIPVSEDQKFSLIQKLIKNGDFQSGTATTVDGLRVDFAKGWGLVRASNTGSEITLRFEGDTEEVIDQLKMLFKREIAKIDNKIPLDF